MMNAVACGAFSARHDFPWMEGIRAVFGFVHRALKENYPQLRRVLPAQLPGGRRRIDLSGSYQATITGDTMDGAWYQANRRVARFTMTSYDRSAAPALPG